MKLWPLALVTGCSYFTDSFAVDRFSGDPFPTTVETSSGALVLGMGIPDKTIHTAVLDVMSPFTVIDVGTNGTERIEQPEIELYGQRSIGAPFDLARARIYQPEVLSLHPCATYACVVGTPAAPREFDAIVGMNSLVGDALRLHLATDPTTTPDLIYMLPSIAGSEQSRTYTCDGVFPAPYRGGGQAIIGGTEVPFDPSRVTIDVCLAPDPDPAILQSQRGVDALFVASTAIGISLIDRSAYARYRQLVTTALDPESLPEDSVLLPSGPVIGKRTRIATLDFAGKSTSNPRSPCRQAYASRLMITRNCLPGDDCPCTAQDRDNGRYCGVPAIVELAPPAGFEVLVIDDNDPTLQALRTELRPDQPEVDGILGTSTTSGVKTGPDTQTTLPTTR
ncbi:hypothetical protein BH11MYX1_BH11MYX1_30620 [soil metagenome]